MIFVKEKTVLSAQKKKDEYHPIQISNAIQYFLSYMSCWLVIPNICAYKHVGICVIDLHKQIGTICFLSLCLAGMVPE